MHHLIQARFALSTLAALLCLPVLVGCPPSDLVSVPNVVDVSEATAEGMLIASDLLVGEVFDEPSSSVAAGNVISQSPNAESLVSPGSQVSIVVSTGSGSAEGEEEGEEEGEPEAGTTETVMLPGDVSLKMVWIEPGTFMMGAYAGEQDAESNESPQHEVTLTQGFWMGKYELTKAQWTAVMGTTPWSGDSSNVLEDANSPVVVVSWNDAQSFIAALNTLTSKTFRLPSEAEWEYACRAGTTERFYWGDDAGYSEIGSYAWFYDNTHFFQANELYAHVVGRKIGNAWGLHDMSGNVWEWCNDWYGTYLGGSVTDPTGIASGSDRVIRGGSLEEGYMCRSAVRFGGTPSITSGFVGFRLSR